METLKILIKEQLFDQCTDKKTMDKYKRIEYLNSSAISKRII